MARQGCDGVRRGAVQSQCIDKTVYGATQAKAEPVRTQSIRLSLKGSLEQFSAEQFEAIREEIAKKAGAHVRLRPIAYNPLVLCLLLLSDA